MKTATPALLFVLALFFSVSSPAFAAPSSLLALFNHIPDLPDTTQAAARWVDKSGTLVAPAMLSLQADIDAHQRAVGDIVHSRDAAQKAQANAQVQDLQQGLTDAGIDMQRMQQDPAYAQQMQARMQKMSPQELMAISQKMVQPLQKDRRVTNEAQAMVQDAPAVRAAADAGFAFSNQQVQRIQQHEAIWQQADAEVARIYANPLKVSAAKPTIEWQNIGCDKACQVQWERYAGQMLPLMMTRANAILKVRRAAQERHRAAIASEIKQAEQHLSATGYGEAAHSQVNLTRITGYDSALVGEINQLLTHITSSVQDAATVQYCGKHMILAPGTLCPQ